MIEYFPYAQLGSADHGWLRSCHHFSFADYYDAKRMGFGSLRVINDDWVAPGTGFALHPHKNMEIITFVRTGQITHQDSEGNKGVTPAGEVQVMSAGSGIYHSEYNHSEQPLTLYQIWIKPNQLEVIPRWQSKSFPQQLNTSSLPLLVSGYEEDKEQALFIHQQARIYGGKLAAQSNITVPIQHQANLLVSKGQISLSAGENNITMQMGDGAQITEQQQLLIKAEQEAEVIVIDAPK